MTYIVRMTTSRNHDREAALDAGLDLFWRRGFHATSMKDLEHATGMHPGSIYAAFGSKQGFYDAALTRYAHTITKDMRTAIAAGETPLEGLAAFVRSIGEGAGDPRRSCMLVKTLLEQGEGDAMLYDSGEAGSAAIENVIREMLQAEKASGALPAALDPVLAAQRIQLNIMGLRTFACRAVPRETITALAGQLADEILALAVANAA